MTFQGPPAIASRIIVANRALCDGTPRREKGIRAVVELRGPGPANPATFGRAGRFCTSPLFATRDAAARWFPAMEPVQGIAT